MLEEYGIFYSLENHFNNCKNCEETDFYSRAKKYILENEHWEGRGKIGSIDELREYLDRIDKLYNRINIEGYKTQRELRKSKIFYITTFFAYENMKLL